MRTGINFTGFTPVNKIRGHVCKAYVNEKEGSTCYVCASGSHIVSDLFCDVHKSKIYVRAHVNITRQ